MAGYGQSGTSGSTFGVPFSGPLRAATHNGKKGIRSHDGTVSTANPAWDPIDLLDRQLGELADRETRLLAAGVGEHYPHEVFVNVE